MICEKQSHPNSPFKLINNMTHDDDSMNIFWEIDKKTPQSIKDSVKNHLDNLDELEKNKMNALNIPFEQLESALKKKGRLKIEVTSSTLENELAKTFKDIKMYGYMVKVEKGSNYCKWENESGNLMPIHHMSSVVVLESLT